MSDNLLEVSVIIPTVNGSEVLDEALKSILNQPVPRADYEIIVVDPSCYVKFMLILTKQ